MVRQKDNRACYRVTGQYNYIVMLIFLDWNYNGLKRYEASIINLDKTDDYSGAHVYRFIEHHLGEYGECKWIVDYHEKKADKIKGVQV